MGAGLVLLRPVPRAVFWGHSGCPGWQGRRFLVVCGVQAVFHPATGLWQPGEGSGDSGESGSRRRSTGWPAPKHEVDAGGRWVLARTRAEFLARSGSQTLPTGGWSQRDADGPSSPAVATRATKRLRGAPRVHPIHDKQGSTHAAEGTDSIQQHLRSTSWRPRLLGSPVDAPLVPSHSSSAGSVGGRSAPPRGGLCFGRCHGDRGGKCHKRLVLLPSPGLYLLPGAGQAGVGQREVFL